MNKKSLMYVDKNGIFICKNKKSLGRMVSEKEGARLLKEGKVRLIKLERR